MPKELCHGQPIQTAVPTSQRKRESRLEGRQSPQDGQPFSAPLKRMRLTCARCGRRLVASFEVVEGTFVYSLPPHKPKGWWKRGEKAS